VEKSTEMSLVWNTIAAWNGSSDANKSRVIDERALANEKVIEITLEKANNIYRKILKQEELKAQMAQKNDFN